jgi:hypothetical protein
MLYDENSYKINVRWWKLRIHFRRSRLSSLKQPPRWVKLRFFNWSEIPDQLTYLMSIKTSNWIHKKSNYIKLDLSTFCWSQICPRDDRLNRRFRISGIHISFLVFGSNIGLLIVSSCKRQHNDLLTKMIYLVTYHDDISSFDHGDISHFTSTIPDTGQCPGVACFPPHQIFRLLHQAHQDVFTAYSTSSN